MSITTTFLFLIFPLPAPSYLSRLKSYSMQAPSGTFFLGCRNMAGPASKKLKSKLSSCPPPTQEKRRLHVRGSKAGPSLLELCWCHSSVFQQGAKASHIEILKHMTTASCIIREQARPMQMDKKFKMVIQV